MHLIHENKQVWERGSNPNDQSEGKPKDWADKPRGTPPAVQLGPALWHPPGPRRSFLLVTSLGGNFAILIGRCPHLGTSGVCVEAKGDMTSVLGGG